MKELNQSGKEKNQCDIGDENQDNPITIILNILVNKDIWGMNHMQQQLCHLMSTIIFVRFLMGTILASKWENSLLLQSNAWAALMKVKPLTWLFERWLQRMFALFALKQLSTTVRVMLVRPPLVSRPRLSQTVSGTSWIAQVQRFHQSMHMKKRGKMMKLPQMRVHMQEAMLISLIWMPVTVMLASLTVLMSQSVMDSILLWRDWEVPAKQKKLGLPMPIIMGFMPMAIPIPLPPPQPAPQPAPAYISKFQIQYN